MARVDASYVIDIAAQMDGGESTIAELDRLTADLLGAGKNADFFQEAIKKSAAALQAATAATVAANDALSAGNAEYSNLERAALQANKAVEKAAAAGGMMSREYLEAAQKAHDADQALSAHTTTLGRLEKDAKRAAGEEEKLAQTFDNVRKLSGHADKAIAQQAERLEKLSGAVGAIPGPIGDLGQAALRPVAAFQKLSGAIGGVQAVGVVAAVGAVALAAAIAAAGVAAAVAAVHVASWAVGLADAKRSSDLAVEAIKIMNPELEQFSGLIEEVGRETGMHSDELNELAGALLGAGKSADQMEDSLRAAAYAQTALGDSAKQEYLTLVKAATAAQKAVDKAAEKSGGAVSKELTKNLEEANEALGDFETRAVTGLGGVVARQMLGVEAQSERLKSEFNELFSGLDIDPVLAGMQILVGLFDSSSESGKAIKFLFEEIFQPFIDGADEAAVMFEAFVLGFEIGLLKIFIAAKPAIRFLAELFGFEDPTSSETLDMLALAGEYAAKAFVVFAVVLGAVFSAITLAVGAVTAFFSAIIALPAVLTEVGRLIGEYFAGAVIRAKDALFSIDWAATGQAIIDGLVGGIMAAGGRVVSAVTGAVGGAINAAKKMLGIASPSKVFEDFGDMTGEGFVQGVEAQNDNAQSAMTEMVEPELPAQPFAGVTTASTGGPGAAAPAPASGGAAAGGEGGGSIVVHLEGAQISFSGLKDAPQGLQQFAEMLTKVMKGDAAALGKSSEEKAA